MLDTCIQISSANVICITNRFSTIDHDLSLWRNIGPFSGIGDPSSARSVSTKGSCLYTIDPPYINGNRVNDYGLVALNS